MVMCVCMGMLKIVGERCALWDMRRNLVGRLRLELAGVQCRIKAWVGDWVDVGVMRPSIYTGSGCEGNLIIIWPRLTIVPKVRCGVFSACCMILWRKGKNAGGKSWRRLHMVVDASSGGYEKSSSTKWMWYEDSKSWMSESKSGWSRVGS